MPVTSPLPPSHLPKSEPAQLTGPIGEVMVKLDDEFVVSIDGHRVRSCRALGCLIEPEVGDVVLLGGDGRTRPWLLAVLERPGDAPIRLAARRDIEIAVTTGELRLAGATGLTLATPAALRLTSAELDVTTRAGRCAFKELTVAGCSLLARISQTRLVAEVLEAVAERLLTRARRSYRFVEESDHLRSGTIDHRASGTAQLHADTTLLTAQTLVKIDAGQIHLA